MQNNTAGRGAGYGWLWQIAATLAVVGGCLALPFWMIQP